MDTSNNKMNKKLISVCIIFQDAIDECLAEDITPNIIIAPKYLKHKYFEELHEAIGKNLKFDIPGDMEFCGYRIYFSDRVEKTRAI